MAKHKPYSYSQGQSILIFSNKQTQKDTFGCSMSYLVDNESNLSISAQRFRNDVTGRPAYLPRILFKINIFAFSCRINSSRAIAKCCKENVLFMALSVNNRPHFITISNFISTLKWKIIHLFVQILLACEQQNLIGKEMFTIDDCKLPNNAVNEWSGTISQVRTK